MESQRPSSRLLPQFLSGLHDTCKQQLEGLCFLNRSFLLLWNLHKRSALTPQCPATQSATPPPNHLPSGNAPKLHRSMWDRISSTIAALLLHVPYAQGVYWGKFCSDPAGQLRPNLAQMIHRYEWKEIKIGGKKERKKRAGRKMGNER